MFSFSSWPPPVLKEQLEELHLSATTYALSHGFTYLPAITPPPSVPASAIHAPLSLFPSPFPRTHFERAQTLQRTYNILYARIALDHKFLDEVMGTVEGVGQVDEFVGSLWTGWKRARDEGFVQPLQLGLFRSDYLLHSLPNDVLSLKQVEFNTISSSFGPLSERTAALHRYLQASTGYYESSPHLVPDNFPVNDTIAGLVRGLAEAHKAYNSSGSRILFVVQEGERNVFDQRWLEYELLEKHAIRVIRQTFDQLASSASVDPETHILRVSYPSPTEISTVYFRAGYTPTDYPTATQYETRFRLDKSRAINCPSIALQLAGGKKVQQVLTNDGVLEKFLHDFSTEKIGHVRDSWVEMWGLDDSDGKMDARDEPLGVRKARRGAAGLVLKPQREGGGNNVYKESIPSFLDGLSPRERQAWIAMELIRPPTGTSNYLVRSGQTSAVKTEVVSELGIFGWALFGESGQAQIVNEDLAGWLVRTKGTDSDEGGVATGFSVLDSVLLVD